MGWKYSCIFFAFPAAPTPLHYLVSPVAKIDVCCVAPWHWTNREVRWSQGKHRNGESFSRQAQRQLPPVVYPHVRVPTSHSYVVRAHLQAQLECYWTLECTLCAGSRDGTAYPIVNKEWPGVLVANLGSWTTTTTTIETYSTKRSNSVVCSMTMHNSSHNMAFVFYWKASESVFAYLVLAWACLFFGGWNASVHLKTLCKNVDNPSKRICTVAANSQNCLILNLP